MPYIKTDINTVDSGFNRLRLTKFDDGLIRGGAIGALNASVVDTLRIGKFLTDIPKGPLFIIKQVGLQLSNPQLEIKNLNIDRGGFFGGITNIANRINNVIGPTRIYNLGINTLAQIPVNAFGAHFNRHGLLPVQNEDTKYINVVQSNNENNANRLVGYKDKFSLGDNKGNQTQDNRIVSAVIAGINAVNSILRPILGVNAPQIPNIKQDPKQLTIDSYLGGPGSVYGVGNTTIRRYSFTEDATKIKNSIEVGNDNNRLANTDLDKNLSRDLVKNGPSSYPNTLPPSIPGNVYGNLKTYKAISERNQLSARETTTKAVTGALASFGIGVPVSNKPDTSNQFRIIASDVNGPIETKKGIGFSTTNLPNKITYKNTYGDLVTVNKSSWSDASREVRIGSGRIDSINLTPLFTAKGGQDSLVVNIKGENYTINDLVKFRIEAINTDKPSESTFMVFRAYITAFDDSTNADWGAVKYIGRGEEFYIYNGFTRKINISFKVAALSAKEMEPMYQKLNFLMSNLMPDYNNNLLMRGPFTKMTVGNWIDSQPGVINSLSYTISNDSPWEIALNEPTPGGKKEMVLPHIIDVNLSFTPIGVHTKGTYQTPKKSTSQSNIAQNWNGSNEKSNYINSETTNSGTGSITIDSVKGFVASEPKQIY